MVQKVIFDKKNILVFGGAGFIGSHLCDELVKEAKVICVDNYISGQEENINHLLTNPNFEFIKADFTQPLNLDGFSELERFQVSFQGIQEIYNLACPTSRTDFEAQIINTSLANSLGVYQSLLLAEKYQAKYLFLSSSAVYGSPLDGQTSFKEDYWGFVNPQGPRACYNEGKRFAEVMIRDFCRQHKLDFKIARIFNTYGPRMRLNSGRMIPDFIKAALNNSELVIYGDGQEVSNYCYVTDIVQGLLKLMKSSLSEAVNLGNEQTYKIEEIANLVIQLAGSQSKIKYAQPLEALIKPGIPDISKAREILGWFPLVDINQGLAKTITYMKASRHLHYQDHQLSSED